MASLTTTSVLSNFFFWGGGGLHYNGACKPAMQDMIVVNYNACIILYVVRFFSG